MRVRVTLGSIVAGLLLVGLLPSVASAHVERPSYWPDPKPDCSLTPCAGGKVPGVRSLYAALDTAPPGTTRVVCRPDSLTRVKTSITRALQDGYYLRPTQKATLTRSRADALLNLNQRLFKACRWGQIQGAVTASRNNDRVVVMPGLYTEPTSRSKPTHDPACDKYEMRAESGDPGALTHNYQIHCPNDANLIAVIGRGPDTGALPSTPRTDRHGIPVVGVCIRCNVQVEGSGVSPDDVIIEAGASSAGDAGPSAAGHAKDVGIFVDRADGFVLRNVKVRHAREHDIYVLETDGYRLEYFKAFYAGGYGVLTFVADHGLVQYCDAAGHGDSGLYPGSGADSTTNRYLPFYPTWRYSQTFQFCDSHHNTGGFSGTNSHGTHVLNNNFYDNALGFTTDVFTAPGHPGFPQHGNVVEHNNFYSNNFNPFAAGSDVAPFIGAPVGTGLWLAGGNSNVIRKNRFFNNWRRAMMLFAVPDATVCGPEPVGSNIPVPGCNPLAVSTSFGNRISENVVGVDPSGRSRPNGLDFWWDGFPGNTGNCWWGNTAPGSKLRNNMALPSCANGTAPASSIGLGNVTAEAELVACLAGYTVEGYPNGSSTTCTWNKTPAAPSTSARATSSPKVSTAQAAELRKVCSAGLAPRLCAGYRSWLGAPVKAAVETALSPVARATPARTPGVLSRFTCTWWRKADNAHKHGMVDRIQAFASGRVDGKYGYGASISDARTAALFDDRCGTFESGTLALYKLYGAAAPFLTQG